MELYYVYKGRRKKVKHDMNRLNQWVSYKKKQYRRICIKLLSNLNIWPLPEIRHCEYQIESLNPNIALDKSLGNIEHMQYLQEQLYNVQKELTELSLERLNRFYPTRSGLNYIRDKFVDDSGNHYIEEQINFYKK